MFRKIKKLFQKLKPTQITKILLGIVSGALLVLGFYQLEVLMILNCEIVDYWFELPFGYPIPWWFARDIFYTFIVIAYILLIIIFNLERIVKAIKKIFIKR